MPGSDFFSWISYAQTLAKQHNITSRELELLVTHFTDLSSLDLKLKKYRQKPYINSKISWEKLKELWELRVTKRTPIQYIIGECYWRNFSLTVTPDVLIPRPETELIIDLALEKTEEYPHLRQGKWLDLGTGSGAIAVALAQVFPNAEIVAVDRSEKALNIAKQNAQRLGLSERIKFYKGSWFEPIKEQKNSFSGILSNPPYIPTSEIASLQPEIANHEPIIALDGGEDGLQAIREIVEQSPQFLQDNGILILEIMTGQGKMVEEIIKQKGQYTDMEIRKDLAGLERFAIARKTPHQGE
ncbi:MAG: peptide chain release factor N(5)-glutamine methyltransferase [Geminocystis sp.]|nr:peptide chain release factor N(5)-glutamine methyltransferase [Geminocystis sp.]